MLQMLQTDQILWLLLLFRLFRVHFFFFTHRIRRGTGQGLWRALGLIRHFLNLVRHQVPNLDIITMP